MNIDKKIKLISTITPIGIKNQNSCTNIYILNSDGIIEELIITLPSI